MIKELLKLRGKEKATSSPSLFYRLEEYLLTKPMDNRKRGVLHPSEISGEFCPREYVLLEMHPEHYAKNKPSPNLQRIFDVGHKIHDLMQEYYADAGLLYGTYECIRHCLDCPLQARFYGFYPKTYCPLNRLDYDGKTPLPKWMYKEVRIRDDRLNIEGHTDGIIVMPLGKFIWEFKTIRNSGFVALVEELDKHREQALIYLYCEQKQANKRAKWYEQQLKTNLNSPSYYKDNFKVESMDYAGVIIQYMNKDTQELKEFVIKNDGRVEQFIKEKEKDLIEANQCKEDNVIPQRRCRNKTEGKTKYKCRAIDICFNK